MEKTLFDLMLEIQNLGLNVTKNSKGYNYKYADLDAVWNILRPHLEKRGILVAQTVSVRDGAPVLETTVRSKGDEVLESVTPLVGVKDMQSLGSAITYARRYAILTMFNIITEDDDGAAAKPKEPVKEVDNSPRGTVTSSQLKKMDDVLELKGVEKENRKKVIEIITGGESARYLSVGEASKLIKELQEQDEATLKNMAQDQPF